ncbi:MAG: hypothetical protein WD046_01790 [Paracoccaceae bacterium]
MAAASNAPRRGLIFPFNLICTVLATALICTLAAATYHAASHYVVESGFEYLQLAVILWLLIGFVAGRLVAGAARRFGLRNMLLVFLLALASAWMVLVANWAVWTGLQIGGLSFNGGPGAIAAQFMHFARLPPPEWLEAVDEAARRSFRHYGGSLGEMFTTEQVYWLESGVMAGVAALTVLFKTRR